MPAINTSFKVYVAGTAVTLGANISIPDCFTVGISLDTPEARYFVPSIYYSGVGTGGDSG